MSVEWFVREKGKRGLEHHCRGARRSLCEAVAGGSGNWKGRGRWKQKNHFLGLVWNRKNPQVGRERRVHDNRDLGEEKRVMRAYWS